MSESPTPSSPSWGATTKLVVALTIVAIVAGLFIQFHEIIGPLLMAFVLAYLFHPIASFLQRVTHISWQIIVSIMYFLLLILLLGMLTLGGVGLVQQIQSLVTIVQNYLASLPDFIQKLSGQVYYIGPFPIDFRTLDLHQLSSQLLGFIQPLLGRTGDLLSAVAGGAAQFLGWTLFVLVVSYFVLAESGGPLNRLFSLEIPGYADDFRRIGHELTLTWNAFLRGQVIVFILTTLTYMVVFGVLGVGYVIGIAFLAGLSKFVPYVGAFATWTTLGLVTYFQPARPFSMSSLSYMILCVALAIIIDQTYDNFVTPRILAQALRVHPAAVLVAAIIAANYLGLLGVVIAAPILATAMLLMRYITRKMLDLDPWPEPETLPAPPMASRVLSKIRRIWQGLRARTAKLN